MGYYVTMKIKNICKYCNKEFTSKRNGIIRCSIECYQKYYYNKNRVKIREYMRKYRQTENAIRSHRLSNRNYNKGKNGKETYKRWLKNNKERRKKQLINWREKTKDIRKKYAEKYYISNKSKLNKAYTKWAKNNPKQRLKTTYKYQKSLKGRLNSKKCIRRYNASKNNIIELYTYEEWQNLLNDTKGYCQNCHKFVGINNLELDHIYPVSIANEDYKKSGIKRTYKINDIQPLCRSCNSSKHNKII